MNSISKVFERTVLNPDFEAEHLKLHVVEDHSFSFETVFYRTPYSYCCFPCSYQHEYLDYLSDKDDVNQKEKHIDKPLFECIVQNVADGRCPHTNDVDPKYLATNHILAPAGSTVSVYSL